MPPPGRGRGRGGWGPGFRGGRGFWGPRTPLFPVAAIARAATAPPPPPLRRRRFPAPRPGFVYVIRDGRPLAVRAEETAFLVQRVSLPSVTTGPANEVLYKIQVWWAGPAMFLRLGEQMPTKLSDIARARTSWMQKLLLSVASEEILRKPSAHSTLVFSLDLPALQLQYSSTAAQLYSN